MSKKILVDAFARSYDPPNWLVEDLWKSDDAEIREAVNEALEAILSTSIDELDSDMHATLEVMFNSKDRETRARLHILARSAARAIHMPRTDKIIARAERPKLYDQPILREISVDKDSLVPLSSFAIEGYALCYKGHAFFILPAIPASNAN